MDNQVEIEQSDILKNFSAFIESLPFGVVVLDSNFIVVALNNNFNDFGNYLNIKEIAEGVRFTELNFVNENNLLKEISNLNSVPFEKEIFKLNVRKGLLAITLKGSPIFYKGNFLGAFLIFEDSLQKEKSFTKNGSELLKLLGRLNDAVILLNNKGVVENFNFNKEHSYLKKHFRITKGREIQKVIFTDHENNEINLPALIRDAEKGKSIFLNALQFANRFFNLNLLAFKPFGLFLLLKDVTNEILEMRSTLQELKDLSEFKETSSKLNEAFLLLDSGGKIKYWSPECAEIFSLPKSKVFGKFLGKVLPDVDEEFFRSIKEKLYADKHWETNFNVVVKDKTEVLRFKFALLKNSEIGAIVELDTQRALLEKELRQKERLYREIISNSNEFICILDSKGKIEFVNESFVQNLDYSKNEIIGKLIFDVLDEKFKRKNRALLKSLLKNQPESIELPVKSRSGKIFQTLAKINPVFDLNGEIIRYNVILIDITAQKESQKDLLLIRTVFDASIDAIVVIKERKIILSNYAFASMFGYENITSVIGKDPLDFCAEEDVNKLAKVIQKIEKNRTVSKRLEFVGIKKDGSRFFVENSVSSYESEEEVFIVSILRDVTERKLNQKKLERSEKQLRKITESINDFIWNANLVKGKLKQTFYTAAVNKITGFTPEEFIGNQKLWFSIIHPRDKKFVLEKLKLFYSNNKADSVSIEYRIINKHGNILWVRNSINVERDVTGKVQQAVGLVSDITLTKHAEEELKRTAEQLRSLNQTKDRFLSIISHDLRTPFSSILGYTNILLNNRNLTEDKKIEYVSFIQESAKNMLNLVNSLLDWTRLQTGRIKFEPSKINAAFIVNNSIQMLNGTALKKNINLVSNIEREVNVYADKDLLLQVFNNLISNSIKFTNPGGFVEITSRYLPDAKMIEFCVRDSGVGIKKENLDKLFKVDAKFTLEGTSGEKGSGLGLSLCADIVRKHGGNIWVESQVGKGSKFFFTIPVSSSTILLVDDIKTDRILYSKLIKSILPEFEILDAPNGKVAIELIKKSNPALVISENLMPLMNGIDFAKQIFLNTDIISKPGIIILARKVTDLEIEDYKNIGVKYVFKKPVNLNEFKFAIENSIQS